MHLIQTPLDGGDVAIVAARLTHLGATAGARCGVARLVKCHAARPHPCHIAPLRRVTLHDTAPFDLSVWRSTHPSLGQSMRLRAPRAAPRRAGAARSTSQTRTSQSAGAWLDYVRRKGWPLLKADAATEAVDVSSQGRADGLKRPNDADTGQIAGLDPGEQPSPAQ
jgi:hypothetical protein